MSKLKPGSKALSVIGMLRAELGCVNRLTPAIVNEIHLAIVDIAKMRERPPLPEGVEGLREVLGALFIKLRLCVSQGEFRRHLIAGAVSFGIGNKLRARISEGDLARLSQEKNGSEG